VEIGAKVQCDTSQGEVFLGSPGKLSSLEECQTSCVDTIGCQSVAYFKNGLCSHYSTPCTHIKTNKKVISAYQLSAAPQTASTEPATEPPTAAPTDPPTTTAEITTAAPTDPPTTTAEITTADPPMQSWEEIGPKLQCDASQGEVFLDSSPGKVSDAEECKMLCEDASDCISFTYMKNRYCSHYSTPCTNTKTNNKAVVIGRPVSARRNLRGF